MRPDAKEASRPNIGRRPDPQTANTLLTAKTADADKMADDADHTGLTTRTANKLDGQSSAKIQTGETAVALDRPDLSAYHRPIRSTRNSSPK